MPNNDSITSKGKYGDVQINPDALENTYQTVGDDLKAKLHPNGKIYLRVRDSEDRRKWNEFSVPPVIPMTDWGSIQEAMNWTDDEIESWIRHVEGDDDAGE